MIKVGDRVRTNLEHSWLWRGTEAQHLMDKDREGTVVYLPWAYRHVGKGTIQVKWDSLTDAPNDTPNWTRWVHSELIIPVEGYKQLEGI